MIDWYGEARYTTNALAGVLSGEVIALAGVYRTPHNVIAFAGLRPVMRERKKDVVRMARRVKQLLQVYPLVVAFADRSEPTSHRFINHMGFRYWGPSTHGDMFVWETQQQQARTF
jgi:hypothetical protein